MLWNSIHSGGRECEAALRVGRGGACVWWWVEEGSQATVAKCCSEPGLPECGEARLGAPETRLGLCLLLNPETMS